MLKVLDALLLVFIFVELLYAVRVTLARHEIAAEPFLLIGVIAAIKEIVVLWVEAAGAVGDGALFGDRLALIGVLGAWPSPLCLAILMLRRSQTYPQERPRPGRRRPRRGQAPPPRAAPNVSTHAAGDPAGVARRTAPASRATPGRGVKVSAGSPSRRPGGAAGRTSPPSSPPSRREHPGRPGRRARSLPHVLQVDDLEVLPEPHPPRPGEHTGALPAGSQNATPPRPTRARRGRTAAGRGGPPPARPRPGRSRGRPGSRAPARRPCRRAGTPRTVRAAGWTRRRRTRRSQGAVRGAVPTGRRPGRRRPRPPALPGPGRAGEGDVGHGRRHRAPGLRAGRRGGRPGSPRAGPRCWPRRRHPTGRRCRRAT